jgi:hypothetical protein
MIKKNQIARILLPAVLSVGTLGVAVAATAPAGAATKPSHATHAAVKASTTLTGSVTKAQAAKGVFWVKGSATTVRVKYSAKTTFTKGTAASLVKGATVTVTGHYAGKSTTVFLATSIAA